ncbi:hypothetical protein ACF1AI_36000, partial [Streptomyces albogriseolus]
RITRRIHYKRTAATPLPAAALLKAAAQHYGHLTSAPQRPLNLFTADRAMDFLAKDLLTDLAEPERPSVLKTMAESADGAVLAARTLQRVTARTAPASPDPTQTAATPDWIGEARALISYEIARHLAACARRPIDELTELQITLIWAWRHTDSEVCRTWMNQRFDQGWDPLALLAVLLPRDRAPLPLIDSDTLHSLDALIGLEELYSRLGPLLDAPAADPDSSQDEHQARILQALREHRRHTPSHGGGGRVLPRSSARLSRGDRGRDHPAAP